MCQHRFNLDIPINWLSSIQPKNVCLYFMPEFYSYAVEIVSKLSKNFNDKVKFFTTITCSTEPDTLLFRLQNDQDKIDAVIYFGCDCLCKEKYTKLLPTLFLSVNPFDDELNYINQCINELNDYEKILILSDLTYSSYLLKLCDLKESIEIAKFSYINQSNWSFDPILTENLCETKDNDSRSANYYPYKMKNSMNDYSLIIFIGSCNNLELIISCQKMLIINPSAKSQHHVIGSKEFRKRMASIEKFKSSQNKSIGIVLKDYHTTSLSSTLKEIRLLSKRVGKIPYFISLNQTDYESRLGNFTQLTGFVFLNICKCEYKILSQFQRYLYPVIFYKEFLIVCGENIIYGNIEWNEEVNEDCNREIEDNESNNDEKNMLSIIERNEQQKLNSNNSWYGLSMVDVGQSNQLYNDYDNIDDQTIKQGRSGIASGYYNEHELF